MENVSNILSRQELEEILRSSCGPSAQFLGSKIGNYSNDTLGFFGEYFRLTIIYRKENKANEEISFFIKALPKSNEKQLEYATEGGIYLKELLLYKNLFVHLMKIADFGPKCYFVKGEELLVLEDLSAKGFSNLNKGLYLNLDQIKSLMKTLARYHSSSLIYEELNGIKISEKFPKEIVDTCYGYKLKGHVRQKWCKNATKCVMDLLKLQGKSEKIIKKFQAFVENDLEKFLEPSKKYQNALSHDDLWCNNIMFNKKNECLLVDFQMARFTPPAFDFYVTLALNLSADVLENRLDEMIDVYYETFANQLKSFKLNCEDLLSKKEFLDSLQLYKLAALTETAMYGTHIFVSQELCNRIVADFNVFQEFSFTNRSKYMYEEFSKNDQFKAKIIPVLEQLVVELEKY